jgi:phage tail sheath protein FI
MAFQVSPGINVSEIDLSTTVPALATTIGAIGGVFCWGPVGKFVLVDSENTLAARFGKPTSDNYETFFTAANFLSYGNALYVSRAAITTGFSNTVAAASANLNSNTTVILVGNTYGVAAGQGVFGAGIPDGTFVVTATVAAGNTNVIISANATSSTDAQLNFFANTLAFNAVANSGIVSLASNIVKNADDFDDKGPSNAAFVNTQFVARYPGDLGNSLRVSMCSSPNQYSRAIDMLSNTSVGVATKLNQLTSAAISVTVNSSTANVVLTWIEPGVGGGNLTYAEAKTAANTILQSLSVGDFIELGNSTVGTQLLKIKSLPALTSDDASSLAFFPITFESTWNRAVNFSSNTINRRWEFFNTIATTPGTSRYLTDRGLTTVDQVSVVVVDEDGRFAGTPGTVLEVYEDLSRATDAIGEDGTTAFYKTVINDNSRYVWATNDRSGDATATAVSLANSTSTVPYSRSFIGGRDGVTETTATVASLATAYDLFADASSVDVSLLLAGKAIGASAGAQLANYLIDNIAEVRKDCVVFVSPDKADVVGSGVDGLQASSIVTFRQNMRNSSYAFIDSGYKYQYDKYNDVYRYIPLNGDIAGLTARSDNLRDPWFSPAGYNRGQIKNLVKLAYSPNKTDSDLLYKNDINPVITQPGQGTILFGDKTALGRPSAFDRINVRRLFITLEKTIATAANQMLFEFNDEFTRAQFLNLIEPFLRDIQGRRGITDFRVVCDETNNTPEVVDSNRFVGDIYIKPAKSINFIQLNFVAVRSGVEFNEVVGQF